MTIAKTLAESRSPDPRLKVCAIVVPEDNTGILALGYNGSWKGGPNVPTSLEPGCSEFTHAEINCLIKSPFYFPKRKIMYVTHSPCRDCARSIINADIATVVYGELYRDTSGLDILRQGNVIVANLEEAIVMPL
jgi:dCMP deaminase